MFQIKHVVFTDVTVHRERIISESMQAVLIGKCCHLFGKTRVRAQRSCAMHSMYSFVDLLYGSCCIQCKRQIRHLYPLPPIVTLSLRVHTMSVYILNIIGLISVSLYFFYARLTRPLVRNALRIVVPGF